MLSQHVILRILNGRTQLPTRTFTRGEPIPQFSVGSRGDWIVSGTGVASFHVLLMFDGEHVFAASADPATAPVYLKGSPIGNTWHAVTPSTELRFGDASLVVAREASIAPPAGASPPRPPKPEQRDEPLPPVTVRQAPVTAKHTGPGNTQFFENLKAQVEPAAGSAPPAPAASADAMMAAIAPTLARQPPTFPMQPPVAPMPPSAALQSTGLQPTGPQSTGLQSTGLPQSAAPPPLISSPQPWQPAPPPVFSADSLPTAFSPQYPGDTPPGNRPHVPSPPGGHLPVASLPNLPGAHVPLANLPTLASDSTLGSQPPTPGWSGRGAMELPTHFAPAGSIALPPEPAPTAIAPTDDGAPLPLGPPFAALPLPMPPKAEGEPFSTVAADADAIRNFAVHLPPSPPDPPPPPLDGPYPPQYMHSHSSLPPPDAGYASQYMHSHSSLPPPDAGYSPTYLESQTPPPYAPQARFSHNPRVKQSQGSKWVLIVVIPLLFAVLLVALAWFLIAR
ncbi:MAG TPA: hypothetical protein VI197_06200 [Polyangiaceae bacterium]